MQCLRHGDTIHARKALTAAAAAAAATSREGERLPQAGEHLEATCRQLCGAESTHSGQRTESRVDL
jgi:hypothetical protein